MPAPRTAICAVVGPPAGALERAVKAQTRPPEGLVTAEGGLRSGVESALTTGADWLWLLDGSSVPRPEALAAMRAALERLEGLPDPALLGGVVVGSEGGVDETRARWARPT